ncbi:hypothetical protein [Staphylococcus pettenkoferi]|uniref:hypothetical protein n=1 Tax=Staphylococcus pettenkoferi TaxID=170573 RepID=UPI0022766BC5|nr:hypothetical protein [Staphylococcus pettenkoferi]MCY1605943.1 hypothetical protein [Staphylococcus pettenkoferi]MDH9616040.1 hypothetical protein [Staphylococcus pettenkoferi]
MHNLKDVKWIILIILLIISCFGVFVALQSNIDYKDKISIFISFVGLFATFGGAYLGAKISGDNAKKLYEKQKREKEKSLFNKIDLMVNVKLISIYDHAERFQKSIEENFEYDKNNDTLIDIKEAISGYAEPVIELLEDREVHNGSLNMKKSLLRMYNECNRLVNYIFMIDIETNELFPEDNFMFLTIDENNKRIELALKYNSVKFAEYLFIKDTLDKQLDNILKSIAKENLLIDNLDIKNGAKREFTIDL